MAGMTAKNLYVALTRSSRTLTIVSSSPMAQTLSAAVEYEFSALVTVRGPRAAANEGQMPGRILPRQANPFRVDASYSSS